MAKRRMGKKGVTIDWFGDDLKAAIEKGGEPALWKAGQILKAEAQNRVPVASGAMKASAFVRTSERTDYQKGSRDRRKIPTAPKGHMVVGYGAWYSNLIEDSGAKAHRIPKAGRKILRIGARFVSSANHPGMRRKPFLGPALDAVRERMGRAVADELGNQVEKDLPRA